MLNLKNVCVQIFFIAFLVFFQPFSAHANPKYASIIIDADTGEILHQRYPDRVLHPASLTKIMTLLLTFEAIETGKLSLKSRILISKKAASMVPSKLNLPVGSSIKVEDAIKALVTKSANDVAVALAEAVAGSESNFAYRMTQRARSIGMRNTRFKNASGLHHRSQISTARDMAKLARYVIRYYPDYYQYFSLQNFRYKGHTYSNHNRLMKTYRGMDGMKTGYINASGFNLVASVVRDNRRLVGVVFGGKTARSRNNHMAAILNTSFTKLERLRIARAKAKPAPKPSQKPVASIMLASLEPDKTSKIFMDSVVKNISQIIGEGDIDPELARRYEAGLISAAIHTGDPKEIKGIGKYDFSENAQYTTKTFYGASSLKTDSLYNNWSIQVGAYKSRLASDKALYVAKRQLAPQYFKTMKAVITPARNIENDIVFRARLRGLTESEAIAACKILKECILIAP